MDMDKYAAKQENRISGTHFDIQGHHIALALKQDGCFSAKIIFQIFVHLSSLYSCF